MAPNEDLSQKYLIHNYLHSTVWSLLLLESYCLFGWFVSKKAQSKSRIRSSRNKNWIQPHFLVIFILPPNVTKHIPKWLWTLWTFCQTFYRLSRSFRQVQQLFQALSSSFVIIFAVFFLDWGFTHASWNTLGPIQLIEGVHNSMNNSRGSVDEGSLR